MVVQRGRKSGNVVALHNPASPPPLSPPADLGRDEKALFAEIIKSCDAQHFVPSDTPLLTAYVQSILLSRSLSSAAGKKPDAGTVASWEKSMRGMAMLATRLRLAPQARNDPKSVGVRQRNAAMGMTKLWDDDE
jgi:hypothetical protein